MLMAPGELDGSGNAVSGNQQPKYTAVRGGTQRERRLLMLVVVLAVLALALAIALSAVHSSYLRVARNVVKYCDSQQCIQSAADLRRSLDVTAEPCGDFYRFSCGRWPRSHPVPEHRLMVSWFSEGSDDLYRSISDVVSEAGQAGDPPALGQIRALHESCIDTGALERQGVGPLKELLRRVGLPTVPSAPPAGTPAPAPEPAATPARGAGLAEAVARAQRLLSLDVLVQLSVTHDSNNTVRVLRVSPAAAGLGPQADELVPDPDEDPPPAQAAGARETLRAELLFISQVLLYMSAQEDDDSEPLTPDQALLIATRIVLFEAALLNITSPQVGLGRVSVVGTTFYELQKYIDKTNDKRKFDFEDYVTTLSEGLNNTIDYYNDLIFVTDRVFFVKLAVMLAQEDTEAAFRYLWWRVVRTVLPHTTLGLIKIQRRYHDTLLGQRPHVPRSLVCTRLVKKNMAAAVSFAMARRHPLTEEIDKVAEMLTDIRSSFHELVRAAEWMDEKTQDATLDKMYAVDSLIAYPGWVRNASALDHRYNQVQMNNSALLDNVVQLRTLDVRQLLESLGVSDDVTSHDLWESIDPLQVNAFYTRLDNTIVIPAGILRAPFYGRGHEALNYATIGAILGHELTHGFDSEGRKYDKKGQRRSWWSADSGREYERRAECFVRQYSRYRLPGRHRVNGRLTLAENIADNGGVREALLAYRRFVKRSGAGPPLPGFHNYTHEQMFWLGFANLWCHLASPAIAQLLLRADSHSPGEFRVQGTVENSDEFPRTWHCPETQSPVGERAHERCVIW